MQVRPPTYWPSSESLVRENVGFGHLGQAPVANTVGNPKKPRNASKTHRNRRGLTEKHSLGSLLCRFGLFCVGFCEKKPPAVQVRPPINWPSSERRVRENVGFRHLAQAPVTNTVGNPKKPRNASQTHRNRRRLTEKQALGTDLFLNEIQHKIQQRCNEWVHMTRNRRRLTGKQALWTDFFKNEIQHKIQQRCN